VLLEDNKLCFAGNKEVMEPKNEVDAILAKLQESQALQLELMKQLLSRNSTAALHSSALPTGNDVFYSDNAFFVANDSVARSFPAEEVPNIHEIELHYTDTVKATLRTIVDDVLSRRYIHVWDESLTRDATKKLAVFARRHFLDMLDSLGSYYGATYGAAGSYVLGFSTVDEVVTRGGKNYRLPVQSDLMRNFRMDMTRQNQQTRIVSIRAR